MIDRLPSAQATMRNELPILLEKLNELHNLKLLKHIKNSSSVEQRSDAAKENAAVPRNHFCVLPFVTAVEIKGG